MELGWAKKGLDLVGRNKKWVLLAATSYGVFRVYNSPPIVEKRRRISKLLGALVSILEAASDSAEAISVVSKDLKDFLKSDSDQIPNSLKQISKIAKSDEVNLSIIRFTQAFAVGLLSGYRSESRKDDDPDGAGCLTDRIMDRLFAKAGSGFASVVVGSFARNLILGFYSGEVSGDLMGEKPETLGKTSSVQKWVDAICGDRGRNLIGDCVQIFVSTAVAAYLEKTMHINAFDELFAGLTNPKHEKKAKDVLASVCNAAVETLVKTSLECSKDSEWNGKFGPRKGKCNKLDLIRTGGSRSSNRGWISRVSSTLSVPENRRFIVDLTGRITFETVRSFLELLLERFNGNVKRFIDVAVTKTGADAARYVRVKSSVVYSLCISLCLQILEAPWLLCPRGEYSIRPDLM